MVGVRATSLILLMGGAFIIQISADLAPFKPLVFSPFKPFGSEATNQQPAGDTSSSGGSGTSAENVNIGRQTGSPLPSQASPISSTQAVEIAAATTGSPNNGNSGMQSSAGIAPNTGNRLSSDAGSTNNVGVATTPITGNRSNGKINGEQTGGDSPSALSGSNTPLIVGSVLDVTTVSTTFSPGTTLASVLLPGSIENSQVARGSPTTNAAQVTTQGPSQAFSTPGVEAMSTGLAATKRRRSTTTPSADDYDDSPEEPVAVTRRRRRTTEFMMTTESNKSKNNLLGLNLLGLHLGLGLGKPLFG